MSSTLGDRVFLVATPRAWNSLPDCNLADHHPTRA